jgi:hypothetical protein
MCFASGACVEHATQSLDELIKFTLAQILLRYERLLRHSICQWWEKLPTELLHVDKAHKKFLQAPSHLRVQSFVKLSLSLKREVL